MSDEREDNKEQIEHYDMRSRIEELYTEAIMSEVPMIVVEGADDIAFYERLSLDIGKNTYVIAVENIYGYKAGCDDVIKAIEEVEPMIVNRDINEKYIRGIIDKDSRFYRHEIPSLKCLFILDYYSFESHLANRHGLMIILPKLCGISEKMIDDRIIRYLEKDLIKTFEQLFYISLEALKSACIRGYDGIFKYGQTSGRVFGKDNLGNMLPQLETKKEELYEFAQVYDITISDLRKIAKGKGYIHVYAQSILNNIQKLSNECKKNTIQTCQYCKAGKFEKCMYKITKNFQLGQVINLLLCEYDENEIWYIKEELRKLA